MEKTTDFQAVPPYEPNTAEWDPEDVWFWRYVWAIAISLGLICFSAGFLVGMSV